MDDDCLFRGDVLHEAGFNPFRSERDTTVAPIRVQSLPDDLVSNVRSVEVSRVYMVHPCRDRLAENGDGSLQVFEKHPPKQSANADGQ